MAPGDTPSDLQHRREVLFEITVLGSTAKVAAIDSATAIEVCVLGPAHAAEGELKRLAIAKLHARIAREGAGPL